MKKQIIWKVEKRKIEELRPHSKNPRIFTEKGMKDLKNSIDSIGFAQPININQDNTILSGHARLKTLELQGIKEVDVYVPDRLLTPKQEEEVLVRMNANTAGQWDFDILANQFDNFKLVDWGLDINTKKDDLDLSILEEKTDEIKQDKLRGILIEFELEDYDFALELIEKYKSKINVGSFLLKKLKNEKNI